MADNAEIRIVLTEEINASQPTAAPQPTTLGPEDVVERPVSRPVERPTLPPRPGPVETPRTPRSKPEPTAYEATANILGSMGMPHIARAIDALGKILEPKKTPITQQQRVSELPSVLPAEMPQATPISVAHSEATPPYTTRTPQTISTTVTISGLPLPVRVVGEISKEEPIPKEKPIVPPAPSTRIIAEKSEALVGEVSGFKTAKGSEYVVQGETTIRNKSDHSLLGHDPTDKGLKEQSVRTIYIDKGMASALSSAGVMSPSGGPISSRVLLNLEKATASLVTWNEKAQHWGIAPSGRDVPFTTEPKLGLQPLELWRKMKAEEVAPGMEAYSKMHAGNEIVELLRNKLGTTETISTGITPAAIPPNPKKDLSATLANLQAGIAPELAPKQDLNTILAGLQPAKEEIPTVLPAGGTKPSGKSADAGLAQALESIAPPIAMAIAAEKIFVAELNQAADSVKGFGDMVNLAARGDNFAALDKAVQNSTETLGSLAGPFGKEVAGAVTNYVMAPLRAFGTAVQGFVDRGKQLQIYSGPLTAANAIAEVRSLRADIREAQTLGPELARLTDLQSRASNELREILLPIKEWMIKVLANIMQDISNFLKGSKAWVAAVKEGFKILMEILQAGFSGDFFSGKIPAIIEKMGDRVQAAIEKAMEEKDAKGLAMQQLQELQKNLDDLANEVVGRPPDPLALGAGVGIDFGNPAFAR